MYFNLEVTKFVQIIFFMPFTNEQNQVFDKPETKRREFFKKYSMIEDIKYFNLILESCRVFLRILLKKNSK